MLLNFPEDTKIYLACGYTDLRKQIDGLAALVLQSFGQDPCQNVLYLFCGRRSDRFKALYWEGDGFLLLYKRLEAGRFQWPRTPNEVRQLTRQELRWLLEGLTISPKKRPSTALALTPDERKILEILDLSSQNLEVMAARTGMGPMDLLSLLSDMEMSGKIRPLPGGSYKDLVDC